MRKDDEEAEGMDFDKRFDNDDKDNDKICRVESDGIFDSSSSDSEEDVKTSKPKKPVKKTKTHAEI